MCGIAGIIDTTVSNLRSGIQRMLDCMIHRGPDGEGKYVEADLCFALGMRRLSIIDLKSGGQPIWNEDRTICVIFNGEIYNYLELTNELRNKGHQFRTSSDTEVLVHLYEEEGPEAVYRLRGMFAYAIWDRERDLVLLVRDRLGIKPLYYSVQPGKAGAAHRVLFSSELPSLLEGLPDWTIRPQAIADFLSLLYVPSPETIVEGVYQLRPGEVLKIARGR